MSGSGWVRELNRTQKTEAGYHNASAALQNERLTRERVGRLEQASRASRIKAETAELRMVELESLRARGFWGRISWLLLGR